MNKYLLTVLTALTISLSPCVQAASADQITVVDPYVVMTPPSATTTAAFMVLKNSGTGDIKLIKAESSIVETAELHTHLHEGGVMKMRQVPEIVIKANSDTALQPGGLHIMLIGLKAPLKEGDKVAITLGFDDGSQIKVDAPVRKLAPMADKQEHNMH